MLRSRFINELRSIWLCAWLGCMSCVGISAQADCKSQSGGPPGPVALSPGQSLAPNATANSPDGRFHLVYQSDGNLVLYRWDWGYLWDSHTAGTSAGQTVMQHDGNLVVYDANNTAVWHSGTWGHAGAALYLRNDGNAVIFSSMGSMLWATGTC